MDYDRIEDLLLYLISMSRLPLTKPLEFIKYQERKGFQIIHVKGSHHVCKLNDMHATVPLHHSQISKGMLEEIIAEIGININEFKKYLDSRILQLQIDQKGCVKQVMMKSFESYHIIPKTRIKNVCQYVTDDSKWKVVKSW
ncbi:MAG TPA: type II toxin-antitoxin system HicA family toxin [Candidatus Nitrosotalea sp.]|nr:type II toxin-antitoxin system HicA family toxin [Candidatus Nitrosotalea sp.]